MGNFYSVKNQTRKKYNLIREFTKRSLWNNRGHNLLCTHSFYIQKTTFCSSPYHLPNCTTQNFSWPEIRCVLSDKICFSFCSNMQVGILKMIPYVRNCKFSKMDWRILDYGAIWSKKKDLNTLKIHCFSYIYVRFEVEICTE